MMHLIRKAVVLAFAGFGMYKAWELANPKLNDYRQRATKAKDRIEPALHETEDAVQTAVRTAADDVKAQVNDLSHTVTETITDAVSDAPTPQAPRSTAHAG